jgi:2-keto-4-pentenoate hydratase
MSASQIDELAELLVTQSALTPPQIEFPRELRPSNLNDGYEVQLRFETIRPKGERAVGYKVACMTKASQELNNINEPVFGGLRGDRIISSGAQLAIAEYVKPLIECEIVAIVDVNEDGEHKIRSLAPSMEINDFRSSDRSAEVIVADNWNNSGSVLGSFVEEWDPGLLMDASAYVIVDGRKVVERRVRDVIGSPQRTVDWLLPALHRRKRTIWSGMLVSTGSLCGEIFLSRHQKIVAGISTLGEVSITTI